MEFLKTKVKNGLFYTETSLVACYWFILSFALWGKFLLGISVVLSSILLIFWLLGSARYRQYRFFRYKYFIIGQIFYMVGAPFFIDAESEVLLKIGTVFFFFSRIFFYLHFRKFFTYYNYFSFGSIVWLLPFVFSMVFAHFFLGPAIPDDIFPFVIPLTFIDALMVSSIPALHFNKQHQVLFAIGVLGMYFLDLFGGFFVYSHSHQSTVFGFRVLSAFLKFFLTIIAFRLEK